MALCFFVVVNSLFLLLFLFVIVMAVCCKNEYLNLLVVNLIDQSVLIRYFSSPLPSTISRELLWFVRPCSGMSR